MDQAEGRNIQAFAKFWRKRFPFPPVPYTSGANQRRAFANQVRKEIQSDLIYCGHVQVEITIYVDEYKQLESDTYADLDNYAKSILDGIKGSDRGIIIDDAQIQQLIISWVDAWEEYFEILIRNTFDGLVSLREGLELYEMPDKLYYPIPNLLLSRDGSVINWTGASFRVSRYIVYRMVRAKCRVRHELRRDGSPPRVAFQRSVFYGPSLSGLHKSRAVSSGFEFHQLSVWKPRR